MLNREAGNDVAPSGSNQANSEANEGAVEQLSPVVVEAPPIGGAIAPEIRFENPVVLTPEEAIAALTEEREVRSAYVADLEKKIVDMTGQCQNLKTSNTALMNTINKLGLS